jgi:hypothetical protein
MKRSRSAVMAVAVFVGGAVSAWFARGAYDRIFPLEGHVHVVSHAQRDHKVGLTFPSGKRIDLELPRGASVDTEAHGTGEGSIEVSIDGQHVKDVGYVTSRNPAIVLTVGDGNVTFSQIFR